MVKFAIPVNDGRLSAHFGHCQQFAILDADPGNNAVTGIKLLTPPAHEPGILPEWLSKMNVKTVIAGGMGRRAQTLFEQKGIDVLVGAPDNTPQRLVELYLSDRLECGQNVCDH